VFEASTLLTTLNLKEGRGGLLEEKYKLTLGGEGPNLSSSLD